MKYYTIHINIPIQKLKSYYRLYKTDSGNNVLDIPYEAFEKGYIDEEELSHIYSVEEITKENYYKSINS